MVHLFTPLVHDAGFAPTVHQSDQPCGSVAMVTGEEEGETVSLRMCVCVCVRVRMSSEEQAQGSQLII